MPVRRGRCGAHSAVQVLVHLTKGSILASDTGDIFVPDLPEPADILCRIHTKNLRLRSDIRWLSNQILRKILKIIPDLTHWKMIAKIGLGVLDNYKVRLSRQIQINLSYASKRMRVLTKVGTYIKQDLPEYFRCYSSEGGAGIS